MSGPKKDEFLYWIRERYDIFLKRKNNLPKPWSKDEIFRRVYFCNVRREDDRVTRWIRDYYSSHVNDRWFEYNIILSRFINWPQTLETIGYQSEYNPEGLTRSLESLAEKGKVWGGAYVITTHGIKMSKIKYLAYNVLHQAALRLPLDFEARTCKGYAAKLQSIEGVGSFLAGQLVADFKNTPGHILAKAEDWWTFVTPGPGSVRGLSWFINGTSKGITLANFQDFFPLVREVYDNAHQYFPKLYPKLCSQDLQNCLCEFDKYMRVKTGEGRSKRGYNGS